MNYFKFETRFMSIVTSNGSSYVAFGDSFFPTNYQKIAYSSHTFLVHRWKKDRFFVNFNIGIAQNVFNFVFITR